MRIQIPASESVFKQINWVFFLSFFSSLQNIYLASLLSTSYKYDVETSKWRTFCSSLQHLSVMMFERIVHLLYLLVLTQIPFFEDVGAMTLTYLDLLVQKDNLQKSQFFKGLPKIVAKLPKVRSMAVHCQILYQLISSNVISIYREGIIARISISVYQSENTCDDSQ